jgi:hypothetical protein
MKQDIDNSDIVKSLRKKSRFAKIEIEKRDEIFDRVLKPSRNKRYLSIFDIFKRSQYTKYISFALVLTLSLGSLFIFSRIKGTDSLNKKDSLVLKGISPDKDKTAKLDEKGDYKERAGETSTSNRLEADSSDKISRMGSPISKDSAVGDYDELNIVAPQPNIKQILKGGEIDDNKLFDDYTTYITSATKGKGYDINLSQRFLLSIIDQNGKGVFGEKVLISDKKDNTFKVVTDTDGKVWVYPLVYRHILDHNVNTFVKVDIAEEYYVNLRGKEYKFSIKEPDWKIIVDQKSTQQDQISLDLTFIIDTTGSMSDEISKLKETIQSISGRVQQMPNSPKIRYGMVLYRDKGDEYLTRIYDFTSDLGKFRKSLDAVSAAGGGDYPEDLNTALADALEQLSWSDDKNTVKLSFLIADAPPHMDYDQNYDYRVSMLRALEMGVKIFPLASSGLDNTEGEFIFRQMSLITNAKYLFITDSKGGTDYHVDEQEYTVDRLDDLIVKLIGEEMELLN